MRRSCVLGGDEMAQFARKAVHTATQMPVHWLSLHEPEMDALVQHLLRNTMAAAALALSSQPRSQRRCVRGAVLCAVCVSR